MDKDELEFDPSDRDPGTTEEEARASYEEFCKENEAELAAEMKEDDDASSPVWVIRAGTADRGGVP